MTTQIRYFRSTNYSIDGEEIPMDVALHRGIYVRARFEGERPERAELFSEGQLDSVIYYDRNPADAELVRQHRRQYGDVQSTIYDHPAPTPEGDVQTLSEWNAAGALIQTTKRLVDSGGEPLREEILDSHGALLGTRRFEYQGMTLVRVVFDRADGVQIVELDD